MKVRRITNAVGNVRWRLDLGVVGGRRVQRTYRTEAEAQRALREEQERRQSHGQGLAGLTVGEAADVVLARAMLEDRAPGVPLSQVVREWLEWRPQAVAEQAAAVSLGEALESFLGAKEMLLRSEGYVSNLRVTLGALVRAVGATQPVSVVTREVVERWLRSNGWAGRTRNGYLANVRTWFEWLKKRGLAALNPAETIERVSLVEGEVETLTVAECERLLLAALAEPEVMGYLVAGLYGGLRAAELERLRWEDLDLGERVIVVQGRQSKTRQRRIVDLSPAAAAWIRAAWGDSVPVSGELCGANWTARWRVFRARCGFHVGDTASGGLTPQQLSVVKAARRGRPWPKNALRHTYASMHYAAKQDEVRLQAQMGHTSAAMLYRHYRALKTPREAAAFWSLWPPSRRNTNDTNTETT